MSWCGELEPIPHSQKVVSAPALEFEITTEVGAPPSTVWAHATSMAGIQRELRPLVTMTFPAWASALTPETVKLGERLFRSWILLFGVVPVEYDDLTLVALEPGRRFLEESRTLTQRVWRHERIVEPCRGGSRLTDRLRLTPRLALFGGLQVGVVRMLFRHRHRNLARLFGAVTVDC